MVAPDGREFGISTVPAVFALIGRIQEEAHRFAITYNRALGSKKVRGSSLDQIAGVGQKRRNELLRHFGTIENIRAASIEELSRIVPRTVAEQILAYYQDKKPKKIDQNREE